MIRDIQWRASAYEPKYGIAGWQFFLNVKDPQEYMIIEPFEGQWKFRYFWGGVEVDHGEGFTSSSDAFRAADLVATRYKIAELKTLKQRGNGPVRVSNYTRKSKSGKIHSVPIHTRRRPLPSNKELMRRATAGPIAISKIGPNKPFKWSKKKGQWRQDY